MIAKKVSPHPNDRYGKLAEYIAAAKEKGEKLHSFWMEGCNAGTDIEDLDLAILEVEATQKLNIHAKETKTYHLMISFRDDDNLPNVDELKKIEKEFAKVLGFEEHQRVIGCHQNTNNFHLHVAYNRVHPETLKLHKPFREFKKLAEVCKKMEDKYGLTTDHDLAQKKEHENQKAKDKEAHTWEESFDTYVKGHKADFDKALKNSGNWQDFHKATREYGVLFKPRGAGLIIEDIKGKNRIKASALGRDFSKKALEGKFGPYQAYAAEKKAAVSKTPSQTAKKDSYKRRPITKHPNTKKYWNRYIGAKNGQQALMTKAFKTWKDFLQYEALNDPLAMAIVTYQKKMIDLVLKPISKTKRQPFEKQ